MSSDLESSHNPALAGLTFRRTPLPTHKDHGDDGRSKQFFAEGAEAAHDDRSYALMPLIISVWKKKPDRA